MDNISIFGSILSYYMIFTYLIQPIFMILVVCFLVKVAKYVANIEKQNRTLLEKLDKKISTSEINQETENQ
ncbi:MAG: hypothetical protein N3I35_18790 [Clostridia bacterium]|nr:hypothetical protein [Clostridia bacterium]